MHPPERRMRESVLAALRASLPEEAIKALLAEGVGWTEVEAFARAGIR